MTDFEKFIALLKSFGLKEYKDFEGDYEILNTTKLQWESDDPVKHAGIGEKEEVIDGVTSVLKWDTVVKLHTGIGYGEFFCNFYFLKGKFQKHGVWE